MSTNILRTTRPIIGEVQIGDLTIQTAHDVGVTMFRITVGTNIRNIVGERSSDTLMGVAQHRFIEAVKLIAQDIELLRTPHTEG